MIRSALLSAGLTLLACAGPGVGGPLVVGPTSGRADYLREEWDTCAEGAPAACCEAIEQRLADARARRDDQAADQELERLALGCPERTSGLFQRWEKEDEGRCPEDVSRSARLTTSYEVQISPDDRVLWTAIYFDRARAVRGYVASDARELVIDVHVLSGEGASAGKLLKLRKIEPLALAPREAGEVLVKLVRQAEPTPFRLEAEIRKRGDELRSSACRTGEGTIGLFGGSVQTRTVVPPPFEPPRELRQAGQPWRGHGTTCRTKTKARNIHLSAGYDHPRRVGAALDWLRRFEYAPDGLSPCEQLRVNFATGSRAQ